MIKTLCEGCGGGEVGTGGVTSSPIQCIRFFRVGLAPRRVFLAAQILGERAYFIPFSDIRDDLVAMLVEKASFGPHLLRSDCCLLGYISCTTTDSVNHVKDVWQVTRRPDGYWMIEVISFFELHHLLAQKAGWRW